ncbi:MAG: PEP-CTERM sorting domain-containing protein [Bryobacteraceae bacterium]
MRSLVLAGLLAGTAFGNILTFDGNICSGSNDGSGPLTACPNGSLINQAYGDTAEVNVTYQAGGVGTVSMQRWDTAYSNLTNVGYGYFGAGFMTITLTPTAGFSVTLNSFDLGTAPPNVSRDATVTVTDLATNTVVFTTSFTVAGLNPVDADGESASPGVTSSVGLVLTVTADVFNVAIDNVDFNLTEDVNPSVPEPGTFGLLGLALAGLWRLGTRRKS